MVLNVFLLPGELNLFWYEWRSKKNRIVGFCCFGLHLPNCHIDHKQIVSLIVVSRLLQWATKVLRHFVIKLNFWASWSLFPPSPQNNVDFSISLTAQTTAPTQHWIGGPGYQRINARSANKIEQMLKYRKGLFPKSVSTTFVAHCGINARKEKAK